MEQCTVVEGMEKSQNDFFTYYGRFGYGKTNGKGIFNKFDQNYRFSAIQTGADLLSHKNLIHKLMILGTIV